MCSSNFAFEELVLRSLRASPLMKPFLTPPVQPLVTLESYLEEEISKPRNNLPINERQALKELKQNNNIIVKKADKGTTTVIMNKQDKIREGQILLDEEENYKPLSSPMALETSKSKRDHQCPPSRRPH